MPTFDQNNVETGVTKTQKTKMFSNSKTIIYIIHVNNLQFISWIKKAKLLFWTN